MASLSEIVDYVIGVDTHKHTHTAAIISAVTGGVLATTTVPADPAGYQQLIEFAESFDGLEAWAIEGTNDYGSGLTRLLTAQGRLVIEATTINRPKRVHPAKNDQIDAVWAARNALAQQHFGGPRVGGQRSVLAARLAARRLAVSARTDAQRQLLGLIVSAPETIRTKLADKTTHQIVKTCAAFRVQTSHDPETQQFTQILRSIARRVTNLLAEAYEHQKAITKIVNTWRPDLLELTGVGPIVAATVLCAWSHPGRIHSEAAFAMISGTAPIEASSGQTIRHRLNRNGDRHLNHALHTIMLTRARTDEPTRQYLEKRRNQGKTDREAKRCLKRYISRQLFRQLENPPT